MYIILGFIQKQKNNKNNKNNVVLYIHLSIYKTVFHSQKFKNCDI